MAKEKTKKLYSVITGDIVKSSKLSLEHHKLLVKVMKNSSKDLSKIFPNTLKYEPELFRGDSWQLLIKQPELALSIAMFYRAYLKSKMQLSSIDARMAISIGTVDFIESSFGVGNAYKISGKALDKKGKRKIRFVSDVIPNSDVIDLLIQNTDYISSKWTSRQSKIVLLALQNMDQNAISSKLRISQQAVSKQIDSSGWMIVAENIDYFKHALLYTSNALKAKK
ncbi:MAG: hypothetical protein IT276_12060 [Ignavibacteriaceae bacterium]|mgnify:FL=1|nr:hypothetical protein [Ignavibacterium sp.]MCC6255641.1 hypothetical protein [Ignavibacteriaceae bacterium]HMN24554.1 SatD family protein [Ignavibacteriaceae bacterium]HRN25240.1 SatD family protein [Ignavibacteriaceae bacterium]HRP93678.1 SatD family protein [Ignavibacteriaceae bacterium]